MEALGYTETFDAPTPPNSVESRRRSLAINLETQWDTEEERKLSAGASQPGAGSLTSAISWLSSPRDWLKSSSSLDSASPEVATPDRLGHWTRTPSASPNINNSSRHAPKNFDAILKERAVIRSRLRATPCISEELSSVAIEELVKHCEMWRYSAGEFIMREGCPGNFMLIIDSGTAHVYQQPLKESNGGMDSGGEDDESEPIRGSEEPAFDPQAPLGEWRREVGQGDIIGEITLLSSCKRTATVITAQRLAAVCIPRHTFLSLCQDSQGFANAMMSLQGARLYDNLVRRRDSHHSQSSTKSNTGWASGLGAGAIDWLWSRQGMVLVAGVAFSVLVLRRFPRN